MERMWRNENKCFVVSFCQWKIEMRRNRRPNAFCVCRLRDWVVERHWNTSLRGCVCVCVMAPSGWAELKCQRRGRVWRKPAKNSCDRDGGGRYKVCMWGGKRQSEGGHPERHLERERETLEVGENVWKRRCERYDSVLELDAKTLRNKETSLRRQETRSNLDWRLRKTRAKKV